MIISFFSAGRCGIQDSLSILMVTRLTVPIPEHWFSKDVGRHFTRNAVRFTRDGCGIYLVCIVLILDAVFIVDSLLHGYKE